MKREPSHHHAKWAALRDAARLGMGSPESGANGVVVAHGFMKAPVCIENWLGESSSLKQRVEKTALHLVKALPDVRTATCEWLVG